MIILYLPNHNVLFDLARWQIKHVNGSISNVPINLGQDPPQKCRFLIVQKQLTWLSILKTEVMTIVFGRHTLTEI